MPTTTANWHWKNKNVTTWAKEWFKQELTAIVIEGPEGNVAVSSVRIGDGDVELGQRKSKCAFCSAYNLHVNGTFRLITIYDIPVALDWHGATSDGSEVAGSLNIPEVSHENTLDKSADYDVCIQYLSWRSSN